MSYLLPDQIQPQSTFPSQPPTNMPDSDSHNSRIHIPPSPYPSYHSPAHEHPVALPKVGQTRCYWALLSSELLFIYLDPVLASHLEGQAETLIGKSLLSFVHPDEQASAKQDLGSVLESRTLHGSVTRVRFSRLSKVRRQLGYEGPPAPWSEADKIALDSNYMAVDIVINWAAEGLVLCFIHAIVDLTPNDNDEQRKTGWTNWCGTPLMGVEQIELLFQSLLAYIPRPESMSRVFQILANREGRPLLMSWPPDQGHGPTGRDFAQLVENAQIGTSDANDAKTSCTRRYKALQNTPSVAGGEVESIFIPHGTVIFACHKVNSPSRSPASSTATMHQLGFSATTYASHQQSSPYYDPPGSSYLPPLASSTSYNTSYPQASLYPQQRWPQAPEPSGSYNQWSSPSPAHSASPLPPAVSNLRSGSYPPANNQPWQTPSPSYIEGGSFNRSISPSYTYSPTPGSEGTSPSSDIVPPARRRVSPSSTREHHASSGGGSAGGGGRSSGNRPVGVLKCSSCKATSSPEWRKGPSGKKELCNACGLRYARSRAKKEGNNQSQRRRKDKGIVKRDSATPPISASPSGYSSMRRSFGEASFISTSPGGSNSGSEIYPQSSHHALAENLTPSPSPPASSMNFVHYSPGEPSRFSNSSGTFYSAPSPLSNPPVLHLQEHGNQQQHSPIGNNQLGNTQHQHQHQLPPLGQIASYVDRHSSMHASVNSPISHSPLATSTPASFERDRDRDRELPAPPLSAESRHPRRSILAQQ
ncbi:hypothetical protein BDZ94DRAFT_844721 [Collybia nuda]|uniref:GATA-type domain-containing protein n=1 Tax=Collybia nuda TaxID=64659 RepID=A0A9P6CNC3_9AGAR|nr:hypothetical protein BDZ94DRAFT_844721 [Collybia nuda]